MKRTRNAGRFVSLLALTLAACNRPSPGAAPPGPTVAVPSARPPSELEPRRSAGSPAGASGSRPPPAVPGSQAPSAPAIKAAAADRLIGTRPYDRLGPADFALGPLEDLSESETGPRAQAAAVVRAFLDGLLEGRVDVPVSDARDVIEFVSADLLTPDSRVLRWRLGRGLPRPEGGWIFPILLTTRTGKIRGEAFTAETRGSGWGLELIVLERGSESEEPGQEPGAFDPTIRTVKPTGR